jgi:hypothetical protein
MNSFLASIWRDRVSYLFIAPFMLCFIAFIAHLTQSQRPHSQAGVIFSPF